MSAPRIDMPGMPDAWRPLDRAVARWVRAHGGPEPVAVAAAWASLADGDGDTALRLDDATAARLGIADVAAMRAALAAMAGAGDRWLADAARDAGVAPFVLDGDAFYLRRAFADEVAVAQRLAARLAAPPAAAPIDDDALRALFAGSWRDEEAPQRAAVRQAPGRRLFVLTGGPGTGKTTTVLRMLAAIAHRHAAGEARAPAIRLAAPTGKAAQRLVDALRDGGRRLAGAPLGATWRDALAVALQAEASTLHRLLGARGDGFLHHRGNPLPVDAVVVDEASMVDLGLLRALLDALPDDATLVLVGDADQLASIGTGAVLADLVAALDGSEALVRLHHGFRAAGALAPILEAVRTGDVPAFAANWTAAGGAAVRRAVADPRALVAPLAAWADANATSLAAAGAFDAHADETTMAAALSALRGRQLLCALREGPFGATAANALIEARLQRRADVVGSATGTWYPGRAVIVLRNDPSSGLFNGDIGLCLRVRDDDGNERLQVVFDGAGGEGLRRFDPEALPEHASAFALTVHKSQGSEYAHVAVLLPPAPENRLLARQTLYTALSRARESVELWAADEAVEACLAVRRERAGRLTERIRAAGAS